MGGRGSSYQSRLSTRASLTQRSGRAVIGLAAAAVHGFNAYELTPPLRCRTRVVRAGLPSPNHVSQVTAFIPRVAQPVMRRSSKANVSYMTIAITLMTTKPANTSGMRIDDPADIIR
jgi:hypothetical protein